MRTSNERGIALVATLLVMLLMSALMVGFTTVVMSDQKFRGIDRDRTQALYAAHAGLEKMTVDLYNLFSTSVAPSATQLNTLTASGPSIQGIAYTAADGSNGLKITAQAPFTTVISAGTSPYAGLMALMTIYDIDSTARTTTGGEVHLTRRVQTVAIPVFQFGMFSAVDLAFNAAGDFNFGGRVHSNKNVFIASGGGYTLTLSDRVTAVGEIVRKQLPNTNLVANTGHTGTVSVRKTPGTGAGAFRNLALTEASVVDVLGSCPDAPCSHNPSWETISLTTYNGYLRNGATGARALNLPLISASGENVDLVRRPPVGENATNPTLLAERMYSRAALRIMLSDTAADIMNLPGVVTTTPPVSLDGNWITTPPNNGLGTYTVNATHPPVAMSRGLVTAQMTAANVNPKAAATINLTAAVPAAWRPVPLTITKAGNNYTINCAGRSQTPNFQVCQTAAGGPGNVALVAGDVLSGVINGITYTATVLNAITVPMAPTAGVNIAVQVSTGQAALMTTWFWAGQQLVTCIGNDPAVATRLTSCTVTTTIPASTVLTTNMFSAAGTGLIGGFLKIELKRLDNTYQDVTMEILNHGISARNQDGALCADPNPNAILRLERMRDNSGNCNYAGSTNSWDHWPNVLYDPREALQRDGDPGHSNVLLGGVMHYVALDVANLSLWFQGLGAYNGQSGTTANNDGGSGYSVYFSDRRNNRNELSEETGAYGWEDFVNPASATGVPDATLNAGEDVNANTTLDVYGGFPNYNGVYNSVPPGAAAPLTAAARPTTQMVPAAAKVNRQILFRRALKLINGGLGQIVAPGFTVVAENPIYIHGDYNANQATGFTNTPVAASVIGDAVSFLSNNWRDTTSFGTAAAPSPYTITTRRRSQRSWYRVAVIGGKNPLFPAPPAVGTGSTFGTDGGAHAFLRFLEDDSGAATDEINFRGSLVTFFYHRQAAGVFKGGGTVVYDPPAQRNFDFDTRFLNPSQLPPLTPVFRDLDALGFAEEKRPGM